MCDILGCDEPSSKTNYKQKRQRMGSGLRAVNTEVRRTCVNCAKEISDGKLYPVFKPKSKKSTYLRDRIFQNRNKGGRF